MIVASASIAIALNVLQNLQYALTFSIVLVSVATLATISMIAISMSSVAIRDSAESSELEVSCLNALLTVNVAQKSSAIMKMNVSQDLSNLKFSADLPEIASPVRSVIILEPAQNSELEVSCLNALMTVNVPKMGSAMVTMYVSQDLSTLKFSADLPTIAAPVRSVIILESAQNSELEVSSLDKMEINVQKISSVYLMSVMQAAALHQILLESHVQLLDQVEKILAVNL